LFGKLSFISEDKEEVVTVLNYVPCREVLFRA